jgi:hypothetical protein
MGWPDVSLLLVAAVLFAAGILERFFDTRQRRRDRQWIDGASRTEGVVSRIITRESYSSFSERTEITVTPVVLFRAPNGVQYEFEAKTGVGGVGSKVVVAFNPALPSDAREIPPESSHHYRGGCGFILMLVAVALAVKAFF